MRRWKKGRFFFKKGFTQNLKKKGKAPIKVEISVPEVASIFKEIQDQPERIFEMIRVEIRDHVGQYLSKLMDLERSRFFERQWYEHGQGDVNHRNGSYPRNFTLKGIGQAQFEVPRDRKGDFKTQVIPRSKRYEDELRQDLSFMFLTGISTRSLSMISTRLIGRKISPTEVSNANKDLITDGKVLPLKLNFVRILSSTCTH